MTEEMTLGQLAAEIAQLRQQLETINQRLDMIYGAVARLADQMPQARASSPQAPPDQRANPVLSPEALMTPGNMLDALYQRAVQLGLNVSRETVEQLKEQSHSDEESATTD